jgi:hypothetical protein
MFSEIINEKDDSNLWNSGRVLLKIVIERIFYYLRNDIKGKDSCQNNLQSGCTEK